MPNMPRKTKTSENGKLTHSRKHSILGVIAYGKYRLDQGLVNVAGKLSGMSTLTLSSVHSVVLGLAPPLGSSSTSPGRKLNEI